MDKAQEIKKLEERIRTGAAKVLKEYQEVPRCVLCGRKHHGGH
jgi:hypothetical protein